MTGEGSPPPPEWFRSGYLAGYVWNQAHFQYLFSRGLFQNPQTLCCYFPAPSQLCGARVPAVPCLGTAPTSQHVAPSTNRAGLSLGTSRLRRSCQLLSHCTGHPQSQGAPCTARQVLVCLPHQQTLSCTTNVSTGSHHPLLGGQGLVQDGPRAIAIS